MPSQPHPMTPDLDTLAGLFYRSRERLGGFTEVAPDEILYIGDHIYGDIVRLKKDCAWRTALVVEELESEIAKDKQSAPTLQQINTLMDQKIPYEVKVDDLISKQIENDNTAHEEEI